MKQTRGKQKKEDEAGLKKGGVRGEGVLETDKTNVKVSGKERHGTGKPWIGKVPRPWNSKMVY